MKFEFVGVDDEDIGLKQESGEEVAMPIKEERKYEQTDENVAEGPGSLSCSVANMGMKLECKEEIKDEITLEENPIVCAAESAPGITRGITRNNETWHDVESRSVVEQEDTSSSYTEQSSDFSREILPGFSETGCKDNTTALHKNIAASQDHEATGGYMSTYLSEKPFSCTVCSAEFANRSHLKQHLTIHTGEKPFSCTMCSVKFTRKAYLQKHLLIHSGEKTFSCTVCSAKFTHKAYLQKHRLSHTDGKLFSCIVCSANFTQKSDLKRHFFIHTGEKHFSCTLCPAKFIRKDKLKHHLLTHTGEEPFSCTVCPAKFTQKPQLQKHLIIHTGDKPYSCAVCSVKFAWKVHLQQHLLTHTQGEKLLSCTPFQLGSHIKLV